MINWGVGENLINNQLITTVTTTVYSVSDAPNTS